MASSVKVDLGISKYKKSYEFKTDWYHQRPNSGFFHSLQLSDEELEEDMKDEIDSVMGLLDRLKEERKQELMSSQTDKLSRLEKLKRSRIQETSSSGVREIHETDHGERQITKYETQVGSDLHPKEAVDVEIRLNKDQEEEGKEEEDDEAVLVGHREGQQKRKQDTIIAELREKAEIISKSARKGPEDVASTISRTQNIEDDPEAAEYLRKIRDKVEPSEDKERKVETSVVTLDFPSPSSPRKTSVTVKLNLDMQKSKIAVARGSGLQGRRKPTTEHIRRSLKLSDDEEPEDVLAAGYEAEHEDMDEDVISPVEFNSVESALPNEEESSILAKSVEAKIMPSSPVEYGRKINLERRGSFEGLIPRSTPKERKPAWKSKTYGGVALPAFAEAMKAGSKSLKKTDTAEKLLTVDVVKQAALNKLNRAAKEDKPDTEPEKPAWLAEAESRRKHHDRRRQGTKTKPPDTESPVIPIRLKRTGSKLLEDVTDKQETPEPQEDFETNKFVVKLKPIGNKGEKPKYEPEEAKISFKLKSTGIQLIKHDEDRQEPERPTIRREQPELTRIQREEPEHSGVHRQEPERPVVPAEVKYFETAPQESKVDEDEGRPSPAMTVRLRHVPDRTPSVRKTSEPSEDSELAIKLRRRGKALPINPDEEDQEIQDYHGHPPSGQRTAPKNIEQPKPVTVTQTFTSYMTPEPVKVAPASDYKAVKLEGKYLEKAKIVSPPTRTKAESTPPLSPTRTQAKPFYKVTPLSSEPPRYIDGPNQFTQTATPNTSRAFSPPPLSPTSKVTVVSHHVETPPATNKSVLPYKSVKGRHVSSERAKTVAVQPSDIQRIIPGRRFSSNEYPLKARVRRSSSLEYPKSHVEASDSRLKHAVTIVKKSHLPQKAKTVMTTDRQVDSYYRPEPPGEVLPSWKQDLMERKRSNGFTRKNEDRSRTYNSFSNKENEPRIVTQVEPLWMRELAEKRRNVYNRNSSNGDIQFERIEAIEKFERQSARTEDSDEEVREIPNFMKEFERKRRAKGRGSPRTDSYQMSNSSYV